MICSFLLICVDYIIHLCSNQPETVQPTKMPRVISKKARWLSIISTLVFFTAAVERRMDMRHVSGNICCINGGHGWEGQKTGCRKYYAVALPELRPLSETFIDQKIALNKLQGSCKTSRLPGWEVLMRSINSSNVNKLTENDWNWLEHVGTLSMILDAKPLPDWDCTSSGPSFLLQYSLSGLGPTCRLTRHETTRKKSHFEDSSMKSKSKWVGRCPAQGIDATGHLEPSLYKSGLHTYWHVCGGQQSECLLRCQTGVVRDEDGYLHESNSCILMLWTRLYLILFGYHGFCSCSSQRHKNM